MRQYILLLLVFCFALAARFANPEPVVAQTTIAPPPGTILLPAALLATALRGSAHLDGTLGLGSPGAPPAITAGVTGDASLQGQVRTSLKIKPTGAILLGGASISLIAKGKFLALRTGKQPWSCANLARALMTGKLAGLKSPIPGLALPSLLSLPSLQAPIDLGAESLNGVAVWHLQLKSTAMSAAPATIDLLINQTDLSISRLAVTTTVASQTPLGLSLTLDLSRFGEPVKVTLPAVCQSKFR